MRMLLNLSEEPPRDVQLDEGAVLLGGFARPVDRELLDALVEVVRDAPFRHLETPGGRRMSVATTYCGAAGWVSDRSGYRYDPFDPESNKRWPVMPTIFSDLAKRAAVGAGFSRLRTRRLPHQSLRAGRAPLAPSRQE